MAENRKWRMVWIYLLVLSLFAGSAQLASIATSVIAERIPVSRSYTIVLDPGHGGVDGGAVSVSGIPESQLNLEISLRLRDLLHLLGYRTKMIRNTDTSVYTQGDTIAAKKVSDLRQRVKLVNETEGAILVSIHQNTFPDPQYSGAQVFYGEKGESKALAEQVQHSFHDTMKPEKARSCKKAEGIYLMRNVDCTGILVECGFLSNPREEAMLRSVDYQQKISGAIAVAIAAFLTK